MNHPDLLAALHRSGALRTLDGVSDPALVKAADALSAGAPLKPLSPRRPQEVPVGERGWGEGTSAHGAPTP